MTQSNSLPEVPHVLAMSIRILASRDVPVSQYIIMADFGPVTSMAYMYQNILSGR